MKYRPQSSNIGQQMRKDRLDKLKSTKLHIDTGTARFDSFSGDFLRAHRKEREPKPKYMHTNVAKSSDDKIPL